MLKIRSYVNMLTSDEYVNLLVQYIYKRVIEDWGLRAGGFRTGGFRTGRLLL